MKVNNIEIRTEFSSTDLESSVEKQRQKEMKIFSDCLQSKGRQKCCDSELSSDPSFITPLSASCRKI